MRTLAQLMDLSGRKALVTGGAGHLGMAMVETLAELGARVAVLDLDQTASTQVAGTISARYGAHRAVAAACDLRDECATRQALQWVVRQLGGLDILVHCAAHVGSHRIPGWSVPFEQQTLEPLEAALRVNLTSAFVMAQEARQALTASGHGSVILVGSIYSVCGPDPAIYAGTDLVNPVGYGMSKGGLAQLMRYLATMLAPSIRVNMISPGGVLRGQPDAFQQRYNARTPLGRMATEEDVKGAVAFLASDLSAYVTGHNLLVDGGWTVW